MANKFLNTQGVRHVIQGVKNYLSNSIDNMDIPEYEEITNEEIDEII